MSILNRLLFVIVDLILLNLSIFLSYLVLGITIRGQELINFTYLILFSNLGLAFLLLVSNPYGFSRRVGFRRFIRSQLSFLFIHLLIVASLLFFYDKKYQIRQIVLMYGFFIMSYFFTKVLILYLISLLKVRTTKYTRFISIGEPKLAREIRMHFLKNRNLKYRFLAFFQSDLSGESLVKITEFCLQNDVDEIYCCLPSVKNETLKPLIEFGLNSLTLVKVITEFKAKEKRSISLEEDDKEPVSAAVFIPLDSLSNQIMKRIFDFLFSMMVSLMILSWLIPFIGIAIKLDSKGPIFFKQKRAGKFNIPFMCWKFRTMKVNDLADTKQATKDDDRITKLGKFLRRSSLDEMPQFINVLLGDMSIIGPRPHPIKLNEKFSPEISTLMSRHYVKPGITGMAQIMGYRGETRDVNDMRNRVRLDRFYIENWSFLLDIKIVIGTVISLIRPDEKAF